MSGNYKKYCCNPFFVHGKVILRHLQNIPKFIIDNSDKEFGFHKNSLVCKACLKKLVKQGPLRNEKKESDSPGKESCVSEEKNDQESIASEQKEALEGEVSHIDKVFSELGVTPIKFHGIRKKNKAKILSEKAEKASSSLKRKLEDTFSASLEEAGPLKSKKSKMDVRMERYENLMTKLKEEFNSCSSYKRRLQILTLSPYNIEETKTFFGATTYMVKKSRRWREMFGILPEVPNYSKGKHISREIAERVKMFYENDEISRICPGKADSVSVKNIDGVKEQIQKRLLLGNLREIYAKYKESVRMPVGFSSFACLRPKWCVIAGEKGTHKVCVCILHQNPKLMISAIGVKDLTIGILIDKAVCDINNTNCMLQRCKKCPGIASVAGYLNSLNVLYERENVEYCQWVSTDRTTIETYVKSVDALIDCLSNNIISLTRHHHIAKSQSAYLRCLKENIPHDEVIVIGDFSENYSFVVQDAAQIFHWTNEQVTLHPFVIYYLNHDSKVDHKSYCVISDSLDHSTTAVYTFQVNLMKIIKKQLPTIKKIHYFSDGCKAQYKNRFNFINLCYHENDFELKAEWNFFATSHGKSACDGIGGTVKRAVAKKSLQQTVSDHILTPNSFYKFCKSYFKNIECMFVSKREIELNKEKLSTRFQKALPIKGTTGFHRFVPNGKNKIYAYMISNDDSPILFKMTDVVESDTTYTENTGTEVNYTPGQYVACMYDKALWIGIVDEVSEGFGDYKINFLQQYINQSSKYMFPSKKDECWIPKEDLLCVMSSPTIIPGIKIIYSFESNDMKRANCLYRLKLK